MFRVFPAFWVYLGVMVFIVTPWLLEMRWPGRFTYGQLLTLGPRSAWFYFVHNWSLQAEEFVIAPLFAGNPEPFQVNGSLWSVRFEATFYLCAAAAAAAWQLPKRAAGLAVVLATVATVATGWIAAAFAGVALLWRLVIPRGWGLLAAFVLLYTTEALITCKPGILDGVPPEMALSRFFLHALWRISALAFLGGMLCWRYRALLRWNRPAFLLAVAVLAAGICLHGWRLAMPLALPYVVLFLAARLPFQKMERWGDFSYGIYIFSFPIQQLLFFWGLHRLGFAAHLAGSLGLSLVAGVLSWRLVEKPALLLGRKLGAWKPSLRHREREEPAAPIVVQLVSITAPR